MTTRFCAPTISTSGPLDHAQAHHRHRVGRPRSTRAGISEDTQALWLPRMFLINLMEQVRLTNWYCLIDVGPNDDEMEDRFGLVSYDGRPRPAYQAFQDIGP